MTGTHTGSRTSGLDAATTDGSVTETARSAVDSAASTVKDAKSELQHKASDQASEVAHRLAEKLDERRTELAQTARTLQDKACEFAASVSDEQPQVGRTLEKVAKSAGSVITYVEDTPVEQMSHDVTTRLRRHPLLAAAGMFGVGFAMTRALKPVEQHATTPMLTTGSSTQQLPAADALDGGMH